MSQATTRRWGGIATGLALGTVLAVGAGSRAQNNPGATAGTAPGHAAPTDAEAVRQLTRQARQALQSGDKAKAEKLARQAQALKVALPFWEADTPERILKDLGPIGPVAGANPRDVLKKAREALAAGQLEQAQTYATQASAAGTRWGIFEDTPTKCLDDVQKARGRRDKAESGKLLAEARNLFTQGKLAEAEAMAYKAERLSGGSSPWDLGDKPSKLLADIHTAKEKNRAVKLPPPPVKSASPVPPVPMMADAKVAAKAPAKGSDIVQVGAAVPMDANKATAKRLMAEGKGLQQAGRFVEARGKFLEAQKMAVVFDAGEETPGKCLNDLSAVVVKKIELAVTEPMPGPDQAARRQQVEANLKQTRALASGFGMDVRRLDQKLAAIHGPAVNAPAATVSTGGQLLLDKARLELKRGQLDTARQLATEAHNGPYSCQADAAAVLRTIDAEENRLRSQTATRAFEAGVAAFGTKDYRQALAVFRQVDESLLTTDQRRQMQEMQRGCWQKIDEMNAAAARPAPVPMPVVAAAPLLPTPAPTPVMPAPVMPAPVVPVAAPAPVMPAPVVPAPVVVQTPAPTPVMPAPSPVMPAPTPVVVQTPPAPKLTPYVEQTPAVTPEPQVVFVDDGVQPVTGTEPRTADKSGESLSDQVQALQKVEFQRLREDGLKVQRDAKAMFERGETDAALESLDAYLAKVKAAQLDASDVRLLSRPVDQRMNLFKMLKAQKDFETRVAGKKSKSDSDRSKAALAEDKKNEQVRDLLKQCNNLLSEGKYKEAELAAAKAHELAPDDPAPDALLKIARVSFNQVEVDKLKGRKEEIFVRALNEAEDPGPAVGMNNPLAIDPVRLKTAKDRGNGTSTLETRGRSESERDIQRKLLVPVEFNFNNTPLRQVIDDVRVMTGVNIVPDLAALEDERVNLDKPVTLKVENISLKSALNLLLSQMHLTYVIQDEVLKVTTDRMARGKLVQKVFSVADLVIPVEDFAVPNSSNLQRVIERTVEQQTVRLGTGSTPFNNGRFMMPDGTPVGTSTMTTNPSQPNPSLTTNPTPGAMAYSSTVAPTKVTMQDVLIKLITNTVSPHTWSEVGGAGTIDYMPIGMALVINQTPDVQEQVQELLDALRRLQDVEVAVEVRILTLAETFFERIGLDFNLNLKTDHSTNRYEPQLVTNQFKPAGQVNDFSPNSFVSGITPAGNFTSDLDIPIRSSSFQYAIPPFAYPNNPGFDGGLSLGLAFLSDIQVYMFMEAAQGDRRTNVMQAPKLTLFNGQTASIQILDQQYFVTNVSVVGFGGQVVFVPQNNAFPLGVIMTIQAVVSADRRFVRLNMNQTLSNLASAIVPLFPVTTFITPVFEGGAQGQPIPFTQFIQQPQISAVQIQTTVAVPDGGTVILGGLKTLSEGRNEFGPPVLSKLPYVNRLFKNTGYGREAQSLLIMVTPRVIINAEEEEKQTGVISNPIQ